MADLRLKELTVDNWQEADSTGSLFVQLSSRDGTTQAITGDEWAQHILAVKLSKQVPLEVRRLFVVAQGALTYGYFFYPLYTLGTEQLFRVGEAATRHKCRELRLSAGKKKYPGFSDWLKLLREAGVVHPEDKRRWDALLGLRNLASHPEDQSILPPGIAIEQLRSIASDIDRLFQE